MKWILTKDGNRPVKVTKEDSVGRKICLCKMTDSEEELKKKCRVTEFDDAENMLGNKLRILCYNSEYDAWFDEIDEKVGDFEDICAFYPLEILCDMLDG